jgi:hypothetical protein
VRKARRSGRSAVLRRAVSGHRIRLGLGGARRGGAGEAARFTSPGRDRDRGPPRGRGLGSSFDTGTFALTGTTATTHVGAPIALVGHLPRSIASGDANVRAWFNGSVVLNQNMSMKGSGNLFGLTLVPFAYAGAFKFEIDDLGGNALASGALTVTP